MPPPASPRAVLLIDADNLQDDTWLEAAKEQLKAYTHRLPVIRAYGSGALLQARNGLWGKLGAETVPNLALEKNTTDASLIADAVALCLQEGFHLFAIGSGDADFAPLAVRLRRWGCEVWCFAITQTLFQDAHKYYDRIVRFETPPPAPAPQPLALPAPEKTAVLPPLPAPAPPAPAPCPVVPAPVPVRPSPPPATATPLPASSSPADARFRKQVLQLFPLLGAGKELHLAQAVHTLRQKGLIGSKEKPAQWRLRFGEGLQLLPAKAPTRLRYQPAPSSAVSPAPATKALTPPAKPGAAPGPDAHFRQQVLALFPALQSGQPLPLPSVVHGLRQKGLIGKSEKPKTWAKRFGDGLELSPAHAPISIRLLASGSAQLHVPDALAITPLQGPHIGRGFFQPLPLHLHALRSALWEVIYQKVRVADVLMAVPELLDRNRCFTLSQVAGRLRARRLLAVNHSARRILDRHPQSFALDLQASPPRVRYLG